MTSARYTNAEHTMGEFIRPNGQTTHGPLPPNSGDIRAEYDAWIAQGNEPEPYAAPPEPRRLVAKSLILSRITDEQLDAAMALMTTRQKERWRAPDKPAIYADDPEAIAMLTAIGANPETILAE